MLENGDDIEDTIEESEFHLLRRAPGLTMEDLSLKQYWSTLRVLVRRTMLLQHTSKR